MVPQTFVHDYFSANDAIDRGWLSNDVMAAWRSMAEIQSKEMADSADKMLAVPERIVGKQPVEKIAHEVIGGVTHAIPTAVPEELPHRRRKRLKRERQNDGDEAVAPGMCG